MNHAVQLMAQHPALKYGNIFEIRPAADLNEMMRQVSSDGDRTPEHCTPLVNCC
jgi:hypothetical protein